ncbi:MAG: hypothetical protein K5655_07765, partial [Lachnospiraceae bacterium]|nr:hypothetical protein [Lachnospiraceae bacterium]
RKLQKENKKLEDCTPEEVCGLVKAFELMVNKFLEDKTIKSFLEDCRQMKRSDYRDFALDRMFTGRPFVSFDDYETEHKRIMDNVEEYIALSSVYKPDKRVMLSIKDMKSANNLDRHVRSIARVDRIEGFEDFLRSTLGEENMPLTLYEYASRYYRSDTKNVMDYAESYKGYIERVFGGLGQMTVKKGEFVGNKYSTIDDIKDILLKYFCEYGANVNLKGTLEKLGDSLNTKSREKYMPELALIVDESIKHDIEHKSKLVDMCATGSVEKKAETGNIVARFDTRIKSLFDRNKNFSKIIDTLMENEAFKQNIFMMGDDEFEEYIEPIAQKSISVVNELVKHKYFDQYLIERKKTINEYIFENKGTNIVQLLNVEDLDKEIDSKWVGWTKYGKIIHDRIANQGKKDSKLYSLTGTATITILRDSGAAKILSLNEKDMRKAAENLETLDKAIDEIAPYDELFAAGLSVDALRVSLHQLERKELIESSVANYAVGLKERLQGKIKTILDEQKEVIKLGEQRTELSHVIIDVGQRREVGRMAFNKLFRESEEEFAQKDLANLTVEGEYKEILKEVESNAGDFVGDELMESVYTSIVKKMIAHAAADDKETFLKDRHDFLRIHAFCVAAEISVGKVEEMSAFARSMLKRGLFEYFAKTLVGTGAQGGDQAEKPAESVEAFVKMIDDLLGEEAYGSTMASVLTETMEGFVNSDQKFGESRQSSLDRKQFFSSLTEGMDEDTAKLIPAGEEERALLCHVLMTRSGINGLRCALATLTGSEENNKIAIETSNVVMSYITGTGITGLPLDIDYNLIYSRVLSRPEELKEAISLVADWKKEKEDYAKRTALKGEDLLSEQLIIGEMKQFRSETDGYKSRIADDTLMSAEDKLWRYYTVLRTYRSTIGKYKELRDNGSAGDPAFDKLLDVYATLQEYFTVGDQSDASALKMFESDICKDLNIYPGLATAREKVDAVRKFRDAQNLIDRRLQGATGDETKRHDTSLLDRNEKCYMPEVLKAVEKVDRWLINTADRWGNSESNFALDILSRPLREKLYLYYVIEQDLAETNEETDTAMAMYSYVPDLDKIMSNLHNHKDYIKNTTGNLLKMIPGVKGKGYFDSWGLVNTSGLEAAMRKLDYEHSSVMTKLKKAEEKKIMAHAVEESVREQKKRGEDVNKAHELFLLREVSYASFLREADKQRELLTKYGEEAQNNEEVKQQTEKVKSALRGLIDSDDSVKELAGELEKAKERNEGLGVSDVSEEVGSFVDLVSDISEQINPFDEEKNEYRYTLPWGLHEQLTAVLEKVDTFCAGASLVTGLIGLVSGIKETREKESTRSALGRTEDIAGNVSDAADFVENVCEFLSCVKESTKDVAETVSGVVTGSVEIATGIVHLVTSGVRMTSVNESRSGAVKFAKTVEQEGGDTEITTKNGLNLSDIIKNVCNVETRIATAEYFNGMFDVCTGILDVAAALSAPAAGAIFEGISAVIGLIKDIHSFMANKNQRETSVDEYLGIDSLYMDFLDCLDKMDEADRVRYGSSESEIKKNLRMMALRHAHFSTTEEYFGDIATQYATIIHRQIFTVKGRPIMAGDQKEIAEREVLRNLFKGTSFTYPEKEGDEPSPTPEQLAEEICRTVD